MTPRLSLRSEAQADLRSAAGWYEAQRAGLGTEFTRAVRALLATVERELLRYRVARGAIRRALLRRLPYAVHFEPRPEATVVIACLHVRRDPDVWPSRP